MNILLLRPHPGNDRFGLGPFFRVEPLGLEYIGAALRAHGHTVSAADLRFRPGAATWVRRTRPRLVGISCLHALEYERVVETAREVRRASPDAFIFVGGHAAAAFPAPLECDAVDAICRDDGEEIVPLVAAALAKGGRLDEVPGLRLREPDGWRDTPCLDRQTCLDLVPLPARDLVDRHRSGYHCLLFKPVWLVETARGCPHRCSFCSVWQLYGRSCRERSIAAVVEDFATAGDSIFVADDLFWHNPARSLELADALKKRGVFKRWILVQTRTDLICRSADLMAAWRPLAKDFDIFLGLEAATDKGLAGITKDSGVAESVEAVRLARELRYGINGNFLIDPDWDEDDFRDLWDFVARYGLQRAGFTILTPLPGTDFFREVAPRIARQPWSNFDMHHLLWEPRVGAPRFFELYAETWRRSILNTSGDKSLVDWMKQVRPSQIPYIARVLWRTQRMMKPEAYLREYEATRPRTTEPLVDFSAGACCRGAA
ncbi:B12-binding domain-containing radical SAM protein [Geobacter anodireducens]|uniref:Cobalamin B12-binding domain-containing protein n=1 Tax=Geobacter anodireducens TaxID=1340425 RepID=A0ABR9NQR1_9BACT|nr:radical SAM protein [Geobacter anodireducens]MBE2886601.1 cobalamin B12-binding domain-containing protein [Geobacter anodireducens]